MSAWVCLFESAAPFGCHAGATTATTEIRSAFRGLPGERGPRVGNGLDVFDLY
jgi:hypothetical protein